MYTRRRKEELKAYILNEFEKNEDSPLSLYMRNPASESYKGMWAPKRVLTSAAAKLDIEVKSHVDKEDNVRFEVFFRDTEEEGERNQQGWLDVTSPFGYRYLRHNEYIYFHNRAIWFSIKEFTIEFTPDCLIDYKSNKAIRTFVSLDKGHGDPGIEDSLNKCSQMDTEPYLYSPFEMSRRREDLFRAFLQFNRVDEVKAEKIMDILLKDFELKDGLPLLSKIKALRALLDE